MSDREGIESDGGVVIDYIKGEIAFKNPAFVVIETAGGVGYRINISLNTYSKIESMEKVTLLTSCGRFYAFDVNEPWECLLY